MPVRILLVDDNESFLRVARTLLESRGDEVVGTASAGADALVQARRLRPDVILVDVHLGEESGVALARRLTEEQDGAPATVILMSTDVADDLAEVLAEAPVAGFVHKLDLGPDTVGRLHRTGADHG